MFPIQNGVPHRSAPFVTWGLIAVNVAVFLYQISLSPPALDRFLVNYALIPGRYFVPLPFLPEPALGDYLPFLTNMFLHGGWLHLIMNMWTLFLFGPAVEDRLGRLRYVLFYLACGIAASTAHAYVNATSFVPALGASGAIAGVIGAFVRLFPLANLIVVVPILFFPFFFEIPALLFAGLWFLLQVVSGMIELLQPAVGGGIAWWAHIGGFVAGLLLTPLLTRPARAYRKYYLDEGIYGFTPNGRR
ncbi:MAG TPA: rhomboid family intramembrane serine protease [Xanthobacteraceae bacterium]|jgi:membrane associated rhomboid family serine protease|nr:rhomboid family intramembrane serine protease [Xanthobacteraceae bacterium]